MRYRKDDEELRKYTTNSFLSEQRWWTAVWNHHSSRTCVNAFMWVWRSGRREKHVWVVGCGCGQGRRHQLSAFLFTSSSFMDGYENVNHIYEYVQTRTFYPRTYLLFYINTKKCWCKGSFIPLPMLSRWINLAVILRELCSSFLIFWYFS